MRCLGSVARFTIRRGLIAGLALGLLATASQAAARPGAPRTGPVQPEGTSDTPAPAERRAREYLDLVERGRSEQARTWIETSFAPSLLKIGSVDQWIQAIGFDRRAIGGARIQRYEPIGATKGSLVFYSDLLERLQKITVEVEAEAPHRLVSLAGPRSLPSSGPTARDDGERVARLDRFARRLVSRQSFSGVIVLTRGDKRLLERAYGHAEWRFQVPNSLETSFYTASITKAFTGVAIAQLVERGKISWEDPLSRFLPDFPTPEDASKIQIRHLLTHSSGLGSAYPADRKSVPFDSYRTVADYMANAPRTPPASAPGTKYSYSNLGYVLLGRIVEIASGRDYYDYVEEHVFRPAGMASASMRCRDEIVPKRSYGYEPNYSLDAPAFTDNMYEIRACAAPAGGAYVTARDMLRFDRALRNGVLVRPETFATMSTPRPELAAPTRGFGLSVRGMQTVSDRVVVGHGGNTTGACTSWGTIGDAAAPYTFVILSNPGSEACHPLLERLFELIPPAER